MSFYLSLSLDLFIHNAIDDCSSLSYPATLAIHGNTDVDRGNISLSLRERDSPITIARGTKNLILEKALDREGKTGPSSVYVNVICDRRHSSDPVRLILSVFSCCR